MRYVFLGLTLGLGAGISPGPLLALVITTTLARGFRAGARVALSPLVTDSIIITISLLFVHAIPTRLAALLGVAGGLYVMWLGIDALKTRIEQDASLIATTSDPLTRGTLLNLLSPHPWLFWIVVGGPILLAAWNSSPVSAIGFLVAFFALLVGTKVVIAAIVAQGRERLSPRNILVAQRIAGLLLIVAGIALTYEFGQQLLG